MWQTVTETPTFTKIVAKFLDEETKQELIEFIANNPESGDIIKGSNGCRKLRWKRSGIGKSGGIRTIYYYYNYNNPIYLLLAYPKSVKDNISQETINILSQSIKEIKKVMI